MSVQILSAIQRYRIKKIDEKDRWIHLNLMSSKTIKQSYTEPLCRVLLPF